MILTWTIGWGLGFGGLIELLVDPSGELLDVWPTAMAIPGFIGGSVFAGLHLIAERRRSFDRISLARIVLWGLVTGLVLGFLRVAVGAGSLEGLSLTPAEMIGTTTALGVVAAIGSVVLFRLLMRTTPAVARRGA
jgi:hypothetical protein